MSIEAKDWISYYHGGGLGHPGSGLCDHFSNVPFDKRIRSNTQRDYENK